MANETFEVPSTATYYDRYTGVGYRHKSGEVITRRRAWLLQMAGASLDVLATADGTGSGALPGEGFFPVTSANAAHLVTLPGPDPGIVVALRNGATGYELQSSDPEGIAINGGSGASASTTIAADTLVVCLCDTDATWLCTSTDTDGVVSTTDAAA